MANNKTTARTASRAKNGTSGKGQRSTWKNPHNIRTTNSEHAELLKQYRSMLENGHNVIAENESLKAELIALKALKKEAATDVVKTKAFTKQMTIEEKLDTILRKATGQCLKGLDISTILHKHITGQDRPKAPIPSMELRGMHDKLDGIIHLQDNYARIQNETLGLLEGNL